MSVEQLTEALDLLTAILWLVFVSVAAAWLIRWAWYK